MWPLKQTQMLWGSERNSGFKDIREASVSLKAMGCSPGKYERHAFEARSKEL